MNEQDGFLRAIIEQPDDDGHRLVYADWLEEHGEEARAGFIREQMELAKLPEHDAANVRWRRAFRDRNNPSYPNLPLPFLPDGLRWAPFCYQRGFPSKLQVFDLESLCREAARLFDQAPIQALDIDARHIRDLSPLTNAPWLSRIIRLEFSLGRFGEKPIERLVNSPHIGRLRDLLFEFEGITDAGLARLLSDPLAARLHKLGLRNNFFIERGQPLRSVFSEIGPLPVLESLELQSNRLEPPIPRALLRGDLLPALRTLHLDANPLSDTGVVTLGGSRGLGKLETLGLSHTDPMVEGVSAIFEAPFAANLRVLHLAGDRLGPRAMKQLADSPALAGLRVLNLGDNPLKDRGATDLARSPYLTGLLFLDCQRAGLTDAGAIALLDSPTLRGLIHLDLHNNDLSAALVRRVRARFGQFSASDPGTARVRQPRKK
jgi:uncharacterized protein (TIGR02996 family)